MSECKLKIGITQGDPNGIGWEVILKALSDPRMTELFTPVVYGSPAAAAYYRNTLGDTEPVAFNTVPAARDTRRGKANLVVCGEAGQPEPGKASPQAGRAAVEALRTATQDSTPSSRRPSTRRACRATISATRATPNSSGRNWAGSR